MNRKRNLVVGLLVVAAASVTLASVAVASGGDKNKERERGEQHRSGA